MWHHRPSEPILGGHRWWDWESHTEHYYQMPISVQYDKQNLALPHVHIVSNAWSYCQTTPLVLKLKNYWFLQPNSYVLGISICSTSNAIYPVLQKGNNWSRQGRIPGAGTGGQFPPPPPPSAVSFPFTTIDLQISILYSAHYLFFHKTYQVLLRSSKLCRNGAFYCLKAGDRGK